nr:MAG TPA: minor tail protein [Caudoviricetes sp.]
METFNPKWVPDSGMTVDEQTEDYVKAVKYGEGAVQIQKKTLGAVPQIYSVAFTRRLSELREIDNFLVAQQGRKFLWTPPGGVKQITVYCSKRSRQEDSVSGTLSLTFTQVLY